MNECEDLIRPTLEEAVGEFTIQSVENGCEVETAFQHPDGDLVTVWVEHDRGDFYTIRDYGETFAWLSLRGVDPSTGSRQDHIANIHKQFDLESSAGEIRVRAQGDEIGRRLLDTIQALLAVSHLTYTHRSHRPSRFKKTVGEYFESVGYNYQKNVSIEGTTIKRDFDFAINHRVPNNLIDTVHTNDPYDLENKAHELLLSWHELQDSEYRYGAIVDNVDGIYKQSTFEPLIDRLDYFFTWEDIEGITQEITIEA